MGILARLEKIMWLLLHVFSVSLFLWALFGMITCGGRPLFHKEAQTCPYKVGLQNIYYSLSIAELQISTNLVSYNNDNHLSLMVSVVQEFRQGTMWKACSC